MYVFLKNENAQFIVQYNRSIAGELYKNIRKNRLIKNIGIDSLKCSQSLKREALYKLAGDWYMKNISFMCNEISIFEIQEYLTKMSDNALKGRIVINHEV